MRISKYKGLYVLTETKNGVTTTLAESWDRSDIERTKQKLEDEVYRCKMK